MIPFFYRYFLCFLPTEAEVRAHIAAIAEKVDFGPAPQPLPSDRWHLTLCVIAERALRDMELVACLVAELDVAGLAACPVRLGRAIGGAKGTAIHGIGAQAEIRDLYHRLAASLALLGIKPLYRESGFRPHLSLGYQPVPDQRFEMPFVWTPREIVLIKSLNGRGRHRPLARWRLQEPVQAELLFA